MNDAQLLRYSRHILLDGLGIEGQQGLLDSHALIIGAGGLGSPVTYYLASAGVGRLTIADPDAVDATNLQRQILHDLTRIGLNKAASAAQTVAALNPDVQVHALAERVHGPALNALVAQADVVLDCSDNASTRQAVNAACVAHRKPLVSGAAIRWDGQLCCFDLRLAQQACYACLFPPEEEVIEERCATLGVLAPLVGIIGSMQAAQALKILAGQPCALSGRLLMLDARDMRWNEMRFARRADCSVCATSACDAH